MSIAKVFVLSVLTTNSLAFASAGAAYALKPKKKQLKKLWQFVPNFLKHVLQKNKAVECHGVSC